MNNPSAAGAEEKKGFAAVRRSWRLAELLVRRFSDGMSNSEIAEALGESRPTVARDLEVLREEGIVHKLDNGRWSLTSKPMKLFRACMIAQERVQDRLCESFRNIEAGARMLAGEE